VTPLPAAQAEGAAPPCSVVVLTLNEEINLAACLHSLAGFADVHVLDSGSIDRTAQIAVEHGAAIAVNAFRSFGDQRNWAHRHMPLRHDWVLHLDADERMTPELRAEINQALQADDGSHAGFLLAERTLLNGRWLKRAGQYPRYQARLVHRRRMVFIDHGHGQRERSALPMGRLRQPYDHHAFSHGIEHWLNKHAGYAMREAETVLEDGRSSAELLRDLATARGVLRRRALKAISLRLPLRSLLRRVHVLVACGGLFDGRAGWQYARMMAVFQQMIDLCLSERRAAARSAAAPDSPAPARGKRLSP